MAAPVAPAWADRQIFQGEGHPIDQMKREEVDEKIRAWFARHGAAKG
jgi:hypothetical protein